MTKLNYLFQIGDFKTAISFIKESHQCCIQSNHQPISSSPKRVFNNLIIIPYPNKPINSYDQANSINGIYKFYQSFILAKLFHLYLPLLETYSSCVFYKNTPDTYMDAIENIFHIYYYPFRLHYILSLESDKPIIIKSNMIGATIGTLIFTTAWAP